MNIENLSSLVRGGKIHEEEFVESPAPEQFRGQALHIIGGGHDEDRRGLFGHPRQERTQNPSTMGIGLTGGKAFLDFIDPENRRRDGLGHRHGLSNRRLGTGRIPGEHRRQVEAEQGKLPLPGHGFGRERFPAALNAQQQ